jgi:hypothetical protein
MRLDLSSAMDLQIKMKNDWAEVTDDLEWPFADPPNVAVFVDDRIFDGSTWVYYVCHDSDDGAWQFHGPGFADSAHMKIIGLKAMVKRDPSICLLADLPLGWFAWRETPTSNWCREPQKD